MAAKTRKTRNNSVSNTSPGTSAGTGPKRKVIVVEEDNIPLTELWSEVFIVGDEPYHFPALFARTRCRKAESVDKADFIIFTGGWADVSPVLYNEKRHHRTHSDPLQDVRDIQVFQEAAYLGIPMVGVCRGAQFLHVMNHGALYQHVDAHNGKSHDIYLPESGEYIGPVSSVHHQMCRPNPANGMEVLAVTYESDEKWVNDTMSYTNLSKIPDEDIEAFWYPETACFGVQGHPEYSGFNEYTLWFTEMIEKLIIMNPDIELTNGRRRIKKEIMDRRKWRMPQSAYDFLKKHG